jgi:hypothetical protein
LASRIRAGETARFFLEPKEYLLQIGVDPEGTALCTMYGESIYDSDETEVDAGESKIFFVFYSQSYPALRRIN